MIGQRELIKKIHGQIEREKFPRFSIIIGEKGSGKHTLIWDIATTLGCAVAFVSPKADEVRDVIENSYKVELPIIYAFTDCDNMSSASANALLKVTEEPPRNAYFILTCENLDNLLSTIRSRGVTYMMEPYQYNDKCDYLETQPNRIDDDTMTFILDVASNIGEIKTLLNIDVAEFSKYVELVIDNIAEVSGSNAFKIADKVAFKDESDKYDLGLFWKAFRSACIDRGHEDDPIKYGYAVAITGDAIQQLSIKSLNKQMLFDDWLLKIRSEWL